MLLICILIILFIIFNGIMYQYLHNKKEGYESLTSCLDQGYPKDFCDTVPIQSCLKNCDV